MAGQTTLDFQQIYTLLRGTLGDHYDFLSCYLDTGSGVINIGTASSAIFQDATGIGRWTFNFRSGWGTSKLQQYQHYSQFNLASFLREVGHRWLANVNYALTLISAAFPCAMQSSMYSVVRRNAACRAMMLKVRRGRRRL